MAFIRNILKPSKLYYNVKSYSQFVPKPSKELYLQEIIPKVNKRWVYLSPVRNAIFQNHTRVWNVERCLAIGMIPILPLSLYFKINLYDNFIACLVVLHTHCGLEAIVTDYIRPIQFGNVVPKLCLVIAYGITIITLSGLIHFNNNDIGVSKAVLLLWHLKPYKN